MACKDDSKELEFLSWEKVEVGGTPPSTRYSQAVLLLDDTVYLFGGGSNGDDGSTTYHGDLFSLDLSTSPLEWNILEQKGAVPSAREGAHFFPLDGRLYLHGGIDQEGAVACVEGLFVFDPATSTWEKLETSGSACTAQSSSAVVYDRKMITFGGIVNRVAQNGLHSLNLNTLEWTAVQASGSPPQPRCDHLAFVIGEQMVVAAGSGSDELWFNDVHTLDIASWQWNRVDLKGGVVPSPRDYSTASVIANKYAVQFGGFCGTGSEECFADLHYVDVSRSDFEWRRVSVSEESLTPARYAHSTFFYKSKLYVFGGQNMEEEFNDTWSITIKVPPVVSFERTPVPRVRYGTSTPIPAPRKVLTPAPPATPKPRDLEEVRTKYLKNINEMFDTLTDRFQQLDMATATLESERAAFESEKKSHADLYEKQQQELDDMLKNHRHQNDEWIGRVRAELDDDKRALAEEKAAAEEASAELARQQETFQQKSKKLDAIMRQVQGLKD